MSDRISEAFWTRKSAEWELQTVDAERARLERTHAPAIATAEKILELAKKAEILYKSQNPAEQRRLLETVLSNCTFDRGSLKPTYTSPFDLLVKGNETGNWRRGWDSNPTGFFRFCKLQIPHCRHCREHYGRRGALHAVARTAQVHDRAFLPLCFAFSSAGIRTNQGFWPGRRLATPSSASFAAIFLPWFAGLTCLSMYRMRPSVPI